MWEEISLHGVYLGERIIGFSLPVGEHLAMVTYEGILILDLRRPGTGHWDTAHPEGGSLYDDVQQILVYAGTSYPILGLHGGQPCLRNGRGEAVALDPTAPVLWVHNAAGTAIFRYEFEDLSGDWRSASFSHDGNIIVLGMPYALHIFTHCAIEPPPIKVLCPR